MTKADIARFRLFQKIGCVACRKRGISSQADVHHLLSGGKRLGHQYTIPLCPWHHRGNPPDGMLVAESEARFGPSLARGPKRFRAEFGSDSILLAQTDLLLGVLK